MTTFKIVRAEPLHRTAYGVLDRARGPHQRKPPMRLPITHIVVLG